MADVKFLPPKSGSLLLILLLLLLATGPSTSFAQTLLVSNHKTAVQSEKKLTLKQALSEIELKHKIVFGYESNLIKDYMVFDDEWQLQKTPEKAIGALLKPFNLVFEKMGKNVIIIKQPGKASHHPSSSRANSGLPDTDEGIIGIPAGTTPFGGEGPAGITAVVDRPVSGRVTSSENGDGLPGVSVVLKGSTIGTSTDGEGGFTLSIPDGQASGTLVFSFIGFVSQEIAIGAQPTINVQLLPDMKALDEVVVVGYGTQKKSDLTGSVASVSKEQLTAYPAIDAVQALQGRVTGVQIQATNGEPGSNYKIRVRGATSINANSDPLFVVDGIVGGVMPPPEDIASMEILKDASSTAIYGSRGANGVVMVTTKSGAAGKAQINFNSSFSTQKEVGRLEVLDAREYAEYINEARNTNYYDVNDLSQATDWQDLIFRPGYIRNNQLSISGGSSNVKYYVSGAIFDQTGIVKTSEYNRVSLNSKLNIEATERLNLDISMFLRREKQDGVLSQHPSGANTAGVIASAQRFEPNRGILDENGMYTFSNVGTAPYENPMAVIDGRNIENIEENIQTNLQARYKILNGLYFNSTLGISFRNLRNGQYNNRISAEGIASNGSGVLSNARRLNLINENYFNYSKTLADKHTISLAAGYSYQNFNSENFSAFNHGFITDAFGFWNLDAGSNWRPASSNTTTSEIVSYYGRLNYNFNDRYLFTVTSRYDGASQFSEGNKWSFFPSGAFAWNVGNEDFFPENNVVTSMKIRTSYGITGNQGIGAYQSLARISPVLFSIGSTVVNAVRPTAIANKDLTWETTAQFNIGADIDLLGGRINLSGDYYNKQTSDLLFTVPIPSFSGYESRLENLGKIENKGVELLITSRNLVNAFKWSTNFNITFNRNKVLALPDGLDRELSSGPGVLAAGVTSILREGLPVGSFFGYVYDGVYQAGDEFLPGPGFERALGGEKFKDLNNDGVLSTADRTIIGDPNPDYIWGLNNDFSYKNFDLSIFCQASVGGDIYNFTKMELDRLAGITNATKDALNRWTPANPNTNVPKAVTGRTNRSSTRFVEDGSYVRLKNVSLGYNFSSELLSHVKIRNARLYVSAQNILTFTNYSGVDPEVAYKGGGNLNLGGDYDSYPNVKSYTIGLNLGL